MSADPTPVALSNTSAKPRRPGRPYAFAVLGLATFVLVMACGRGNHGRFQATALLWATRSSDAPPPMSLGELQTALAREESVQKAIDDVRETVVPEPADSALQEIRCELTVEAKEAESAQRRAYRVSCIGAGRKLTLAFVDRICNQFIHQQAAHRRVVAAAGETTSIPPQAARKAREEYELAKASLDTFIDEHFQQLQMGDVHESAEEATLHETATATNLRNAQQRVSAIETELERLKAKREQLLEKMTSDHPDLVQLADRIETLQGRLDDLLSPPGQLDGNESRGDASQMLADATAEEEAEQRRVLAEYARLKKAVETARAKQLAAREADRHAQASCSARRPAVAWRAEPAAITGRFYEPSSLALMMLGVLLGAVAGGSFLFAFGGATTISTVADAETALSVPVVGKLTAPGSSQPASPLLRPVILRVLMVAAEIVLFLFLGATLLAACLDKDFASQLSGDPLSALADGVHRVVEIIWR